MHISCHDQHGIWEIRDRLARSNAYTAPKDGRIGQDYLDKNIPVIERRLSMASVRLAALLNVIFDETKELPF